MADENKKFPNGWGSDEDDDDYGFIDDTDEDDEDSAWGNGSPFKKKESVTDSNENEESDNGQTEASVSAQKVKTSENSAAPVPPVNPPYNQGYVIQKQKSSPLFIIVIIILVLIIGVLCTAIFMVNKNKKTNGSEKSSVNSVDEISETNATKDSEFKSNEEIINKMIKQEVLNDIAISFSNASDSALIEMDEEGYDINGYFIIASDKKYNYNVPTENFDEDVFYTKLNYYNDGDNSGFAWFVVVNDQMCIYAAVSNSWEDEKSTGYYNGVGTRVIRSQCEPKDLDNNNIKVLYEQLKSMESTITAPYTEAEEDSDSLEFDTQPKTETTNKEPTSPATEIVKVYPCNYLGVINTHGLGVTGFATSYVVDGGAVEEVRHRLGDWHVKAVRYCNSKDVLWYELYDSEDGDYYGWVDAEYIDFSPSNTSEYTDKSNLIAVGKVITEKDDLNMRESNSADSKIIKTIPKGHYVGIISEYGDWLYVKYYADTNSPIYYGFVSKQFIEITERY